MTLVLVTGPPASGKTTLARPLAHHLDLPLLGKDTIKEALFDTLGTGDRAWSRRLGAASYGVLLAMLREIPAAVVDANFYPTTAQACSRRASGPSRSSAAARPPRWNAASPNEHPLKAALHGGVGPLGLGGPVLEVDTSGPVDVTAVARWVKQQPDRHLPMPSPPTHNPARK